MDLGLRGKRALVTGSSSGLGAGAVLELAAEGMKLVVHGRDADRAEAVAREAAALGAEVLVATGDLAKDEDAARVAAAATERFGGIDVLVNNAGAAINMNKANWLDVSPDDWLDCYNLNVVAAVRMAQHLAPGMVERGWGRIINISSVAGSQMVGRLFDYGAAKAGLNSFTVNLSKELAPHGVTVNCIIPGKFMSPAAETWIKTMARQREWSGDFAEHERRYAKQPIARLGRAREMATAVAMLASPLSDYTTGAFLRIDGGAANTIGV